MIDTPETAGMPEQGWTAGQAPKVKVKGVNIDEKIDEVLRNWKTYRPHEVPLFETMIAQMRNPRKSGPVMTRHRNYVHFAEIPAYIYYALGIAIGCRDWILDEEIRERFYRHFRACLLNPKNPSTQRG